MKTEVKDFNGKVFVLEHDGGKAALDYVARYQANIERDKQLIEDGVPALKRLMQIAETNASGQAEYIAKFLLGLYNGYRFPFELPDLRALDETIKDDCLVVLEMDMKACRREVHRYFENGGERFEAMAMRFES